MYDHDHSMPVDKTVQARLVQKANIYMGSTPDHGGRFSNNAKSVYANILIHWIEGFGVLHVVSDVENVSGNDDAYEDLRGRRMEYVESFSKAAARAVEIVKEFAARAEEVAMQIPADKLRRPEAKAMKVDDEAAR